MPNAILQSPADEKQLIPKVPKESGSAEPQQLDADEIQTAMHLMVSQAVAFVDGEMGTCRAEAEKYFKGELFGNEEDGRSKVVMTEVRDAILMILPSLIRIFFGADPAVEYGPSTMAQLKMAEQVTKFVLDVILQLDNSGFLVFHDWFMDALLKRLGVVKYWKDDGDETREYHVAYQGLEQVMMLAQDDTIELQDVHPCEVAPPGSNLFDVDYKQTKTWSRIRVTCIPPEEYLYSKGARTASNDPSAPGVATFVGHRTQLRRVSSAPSASPMKTSRRMGSPIARCRPARKTSSGKTARSRPINRPLGRRPRTPRSGSRATPTST